MVAGNRRLASEMISKPRSTSQPLRKSAYEGVERYARHIALDELDSFEDVGQACYRRACGHSEHLQCRRLNSVTQHPVQTAPGHDVGLASEDA